MEVCRIPWCQAEKDLRGRGCRTLQCPCPELQAGSNEESPHPSTQDLLAQGRADRKRSETKSSAWSQADAICLPSFQSASINCAQRVGLPQGRLRFCQSSSGSGRGGWWLYLLTDALLLPGNLSAHFCTARYLPLGEVFSFLNLCGKQPHLWQFWGSVVTS